MRTTATLDGGEWVVNGTKAFITNAGTSITSLVTVLALTGGVGGQGGEREISTIVIPSGTPGFQPAPKYSKVGWCASDTRELSFADCRVPEANLLGERGRGYAQFLRILDEGRVAISSLATGLAQGCVDECTRYANEWVRSASRSAGTRRCVSARRHGRAGHAARLACTTPPPARRRRPFKKEAEIAKLLSSNAAMENARTLWRSSAGPAPRS